MDVSAAIKGRRSVRSYKDQEIENDKIERILEAGRLSPSANNRQEWKFIVVKNAETKKKLARAAMNQSFIGQAPVVLAACATESDLAPHCSEPSPDKVFVQHTTNLIASVQIKPGHILRGTAGFPSGVAGLKQVGCHSFYCAIIEH